MHNEYVLSAQAEMVVATVMQAIQLRFDADAIVAGGWARDTYMFREPKDVDVWFHTDVPVDEFLPALQEELPGITVTVVLESQGAEAWTKWIAKITYAETKFDLIAFSTPVGHRGEAVLGRFDFGICKIAWKPGIGYIITPEFLVDFAEKRLTYCDAARNAADMPRAIHDHLPRLQEKFPEYTVVGLPEVPPTAADGRYTTFVLRAGSWGDGVSKGGYG